MSYDLLNLPSVVTDFHRLISVSDDHTEFIDTWHVTDHLGNVRAVVDITDTGESVEDIMDLVLEQNDYRPFGERVDDERMEVDGENRYRFAGKEEQTFLNGTYSDFGARFYSSDIQRWTTPDPLSDAINSAGSALSEAILEEFVWQYEKKHH